MKYWAVFLVFLCSPVKAQRVQTLRLRHYKVGDLGEKLRESSGLVIYNGKLFTVNDGGNRAEIFEIEKSTGKILATVELNIDNCDWEALASDGRDLYIGDFGNNYGSRRDLTVYKISGSTADIQRLPFFYPEQRNFSPMVNSHNFDAEALVFFNGKLHLFTKEWLSQKTSHYTISYEGDEPAAAKKSEEFAVHFFVTDAAVFQDKLYLLGYNRKGRIFLDIFETVDSDVFFSKVPRRFYLGSALSLGQAEGLAVDESGIYISSESFTTPVSRAKAGLFFVPWAAVK